jgi:ParB family chromosome partitioning protein
MKRRHGLGRGLEALIPAAEDLEQEQPGDRLHARKVPIDRVQPNAEQPRRSFDPEALQELADSIKVHGILQPLLVREVASGYEVIAGERRLRAARMAGLELVPVVVHQPLQPRPADRLELALVENVQRADLNPIEKARAMKRLVEEYGLTQREIGERIGRTGTAVSNTMRLLALPPPILHAVEEGKLAETQARPLLALPTDAQRLAAMERILKEKWDQRQIETWVRNSAVYKPRTYKRRKPVDADTLALEEEFRRALGTKVVITRIGEAGRLIIEFYSNADLEALRRKLVGD